MSKSSCGTKMQHLRNLRGMSRSCCHEKDKHLCCDISLIWTKRSCWRLLLLDCKWKKPSIKIINVYSCIKPQSKLKASSCLKASSSWIHPSLYSCLPNLEKDGILRDSPTSVDADIFDDTFTQRFRYWLLPHLTRLK